MKNDKLREEVGRIVAGMGYDNFDFYLAARLGVTIKAIARELGIKYWLFQKFHQEYIAQKREELRGNRVGRKKSEGTSTVPAKGLAGVN
jgi:hypothetical protein